MTALMFRRATLADETAVLALTAPLIDGPDYIAHSFQAWVHDQRGIFVVVLADEQLVATSKISELGPGEWWFEGLRVARTYRQRGIATALQYHLVKTVEEMGWGTVRFLTGSNNRTVCRLADMTQFFRRSCHYLADKPLPSSLNTAWPVNFSPVHADELPLLQSLLPPQATMVDGRKMLNLMPRLHNLQTAQRLLWWRHPPYFAIIRQGKTRFHLNYLHIPAEHYAPFLADLEQMGQYQAAQALHCRLEVDPILSQNLIATGWIAPSDVQLYAYERPLARAANLNHSQGEKST